MTINRVAPGGSFRPSWVSSGATANPICYNIFTGSESLVSSYAGVDSGNGHYYVDAVINSPGIWKGEWFATVNANTYRNAEFIAAFPGDSDQPGRYITWDDVVNRFSGFADTAGAVEAASHYLSYAEAYLDSRLGGKFTTPFSNNNMTVRDLTIDIVYARSVRASLSDVYRDVWAEVNSRISGLLSGDEVMITSSGALTGDASSTPAWSNTQSYHPFFSPVLDETLVIPSSDWVQDELDARGI